MTSFDTPNIRALAALREAKPKQYDVLALLLSNPGATHQAIAEALGTSRANVTKLVGRALRNLEELRERAGRTG